MSFGDVVNRENGLNENNNQFILNIMQMNISESKFKTFIKELFYSVSIKNQNGISISDIFSISNILNISFPVCLRILNSLKHEIDQYLILEEEFVTICQMIYFSTFEEKIDLFFKICDVSNTDTLYKSDIIILFKHLLHSYMDDGIMTLIDNFFNEGKESLLKKQYLSTVSKCADLIYLFFITISNNKIFNEDIINYYNKNIACADNTNQPVIRKIFSSQVVGSNLAFKRPTTKKVSFKNAYDDIMLYNSSCAITDSYQNTNHIKTHPSISNSKHIPKEHTPSSKLLSFLNKAFNYNFVIDASSNMNDDLDNCDDLEELSLFETQVVGSLQQFLQRKNSSNSDSKHKETFLQSPQRLDNNVSEIDFTQSEVKKLKYYYHSQNNFTQKSSATSKTAPHINKISKISEFDKVELKKYGECKLYLNGCFLFIVLTKEQNQNAHFNLSPIRKLAKMPSVLLLKNICFSVNINNNTITLNPIHYKKYEFVFNKKTQYNKFIKKLDKLNPQNYLRYQLEYEVIELLSDENPLSFYAVKYKSTGCFLKQKTISKLSFHDNEFEIEKYVLNYLKQHPHKNIVHIKDIYESIEHIYIIFEHKHSDCSNVDVYTCLYDLLQGLHYLHSNGIVHRNINIENIIHDNVHGSCFKISNFSLSRTFFPSEMFKDELPYGVFSAPEIIERKKYNYSCDVWSYGIVCFCLLEGRIPFKEGSKDEMILYINDFLSKSLVKHNEEWKMGNKVYEKILTKTLIKSMFSRPSTSELLKMFQ